MDSSRKVQCRALCRPSLTLLRIEQILDFFTEKMRKDERKAPRAPSALPRGLMTYFPQVAGRISA
jgi:hypothetical protein